MKYLLITLLVFYGLAFWSGRAASQAHGDDFGAAFPAIFCGVVSAILTLVYVGLAFWNHKFF